MPKQVFNTSASKTVTFEDENGNVCAIQPSKMRVVSDDIADKLSKEWKDIQVSDVSEAGEPWELAVLPSLPPEMQAKVKFKVPKKLKPAATPEVLEPSVPVDDVEKQKLGKPSNLHVCPRGCGYQSEKLKAVRMHMLHCPPIPAMATE